MYHRVMVVDDNSTDRYIAELSIKKFGFANEVIVNDSAVSALDYLTLEANSDNLPELIFLDINMPEMSGFEFLDAYDNLPAVVRNNCTVIMLSSSLDSTDVLRASQNKYVVKFVNKPLVKNVLQQLLTELN